MPWIMENTYITLVEEGPFCGMEVNLKSVPVTAGLGVQSMVLVRPMQEHTKGHCPEALCSKKTNATSDTSGNSAIASTLFCCLGAGLNIKRAMNITCNK